MNDPAETAREAAIELLYAVADLMGQENLPRPITVSFIGQASVLVSAEHLPAWCDALDVPVPAWELHPSTKRVEFAETTGGLFTVETNRVATSEAVAS